ncbi:MAG: hypothetical protein AAGB00_10135, partial [Planctomycetota bacterium]
FGGGACLGAGASLRRASGVSVAPWSVRGLVRFSHAPLAMLGPAIALSTLAWTPKRRRRENG